MKREPMLLDDLQEMSRLLASEDWEHYIEFKEERRKHLFTRMISEVRGGEIVKAQISLALAEDIEKEIGLFKQRIIEIRKKAKGEI